MEAISAVNLFMSTRKAQMGDNLVRMNKLLMDVMAETVTIRVFVVHTPCLLYCLSFRLF